MRSARPTRLTRAPSRAERIVTTSPSLWVKPLPGASRSSIGANITDSQQHSSDPSGGTFTLRLEFVIGIKGKVVSRGANVNLADRDGMTPLLAFVKRGAAGFVNKVLKAGADPNAVLKLELKLASKSAGASRVTVAAPIVNAPVMSPFWRR